MAKKREFIRFGKSGFFSKMGTIFRLQVPTRQGRMLSLFFNKQNNLVVGDVITKSGKSGVEFLRTNLKNIKLRR